MEFGIFIQGYMPGSAAHDSDAEHRGLLNEIELVKCADKNNRKYVIPEYDKDPVHRTDRMRATAQPKFGPFEHEPPDIRTVMTGQP